jgi:hypothetical protein
VSARIALFTLVRHDTNEAIPGCRVVTADGGFALYAPDGRYLASVTILPDRTVEITRAGEESHTPPDWVRDGWLEYADECGLTAGVPAP